MSVRIKVANPTFDSLITQISANYTSGTILTVLNNSDFNISDYILIERLGSFEAEIAQISSFTGKTIINLVSALNFPHNQDAQVSRIDYNTINVYRSTTGLGGTYALIGSAVALQVDQDFTIYLDSSGTSTYSYKVRYYNTSNTVEALDDGEHPSSGFPFYALGAIYDRVAKLYVDTTAEFISFVSISDWCNELTTRLNREVVGSESALFVNYLTFTPGNNEYTDLSSQNIEAIILAEYSTDSGVTWENNPISPMDARIKAPSPLTTYSYKMIDQKFFVYTSSKTSAVTPDFPATNMVRLWIYTQPTLMKLSSDLLPTVYRSFTDVYIDYCMMRANEQSRRFQESAAYYFSKLFKGNREMPASIKMVTDSVASRIDQGNKSIATTWLNNL